MSNTNETQTSFDRYKLGLVAKRDPISTMEVVTNGKHTPYWHQRVVNDYIMRAARREITRLIVNMPPRHSKSTLISYMFPLWSLSSYPDENIMLASYEVELASSWGRKVRDTLDLYSEDIFGVRVSDKSSAADRWAIDGHEGGMLCVGVGGPLTGRGTSCLLVDDVLKNSEEARSQVIREKQWDWWLGTTQTRLEPTKDGREPIVIILGTRWHSDDLMGRLIDQDPDEWVVLNLPAIAERDEEWVLSDGTRYTRSTGEALWPERFPLAALDKVRRSTPFWFLAEYQGHPSAEEGEVFKRHGVRYWKPGKATTQDGQVVDGYLLRQANGEYVFTRASNCWHFVTVDLAASEREYADYTVYQAWAVTPQSDMILLEQMRGRIPGPEKLDALKGIMMRHDASFSGIEKAGFQLDFIQNARWAGLNVVELKPKGDKMGRALEASTRWDNGQIYLPNNAHWVSAFIEEVCTFPNAPHDDQVDALSYAAIEVSRRGFSPQHAYGLHECTSCHKMYTLTERTGLDRPCPYCHTKPVIDQAENLVPILVHDEATAN